MLPPHHNKQPRKKAISAKQRLGHELASARHDQYTSVEQAAELLGLSVEAVTDYEQGRAELPAETVQHLLHALKPSWDREFVVYKILGEALGDEKQPKNRQFRQTLNEASPDSEPIVSMTTHIRRTVFLCHSSSDKERVRALYKRLSRDGVNCWFDEESLLPGQDWSYEITKVIRASQYVLVCLSKDSVTTRGYMHKKIVRALDVAEEQPEGVAYIIPVRLEECEIPERLRRWHWVSLFIDGSYEKLLKVLRAPGTEGPASVTGQVPKIARLGVRRFRAARDDPRPAW